MSILTAIIFLPLLTALVLAFVPRTYSVVMQGAAIFATLGSALLAVVMFCGFHAGAPGYQFEQRNPWVASLGLSYHVGVDGINVGLVLMAAIVALAAACAGWEIRRREKEFYILLLLMAGGVLGAFASLDLFLFYFFHELALVPTFIMIGVWGRGDNRVYTAFNITLYLSLGALIALIGLIALYVQAGANSFDIADLTKYLAEKPLSGGSQHFIFPLLLFGFGILVSLWPFHTWAPAGYAYAPTSTAMLHAGALKKFGLYGLIRIALPLLPDAAHEWARFIAWLCLGNLIYCGWVAMRQTDLKRLAAYSSIAHMGFVFLGIAAFNLIGITGAVVVMIAHGFLAALTFALTGLIGDRAGTFEMSQMGGLLRRLPFVGGALMVAAFAGCGLPGFANFIGEVAVLFGAWKDLPAFTVLAAWGALIIGAVYMLRAVRSVLQGPLPETIRFTPEKTSLWRKLPILTLLACLVIFGCFPGLLTQKITPSVAENVLRSPTASASVVVRASDSPFDHSSFELPSDFVIRASSLR